MRTLLLAALLPGLLSAQVSVRSFYDTFTASGPLLDHVTALPNGDVLYYDQGFGGVARLDAQGGVVWYARIDITGVPTDPGAVAHAAVQSNGNIVLALVQRDAQGDHHPGLMRLDPNGNLISARMDWDTDISLGDWLQLVVIPGSDDIRLSIRGTGNGGSFHAFNAQGDHQWSLGFAGNSEVPVSMIATPTALVGATVGKLVTYTQDGVPNAILAPGPVTVNGTVYSAFIVDVVPVSIGFAFSFLRTGGTSLMAPGIGIVSSSGVFQGAIVFDMDELQGQSTLFSYPQLCSTFGGLAMVANNGSSTDPTGYLFSCDFTLGAPQVQKVAIGTESYPSDITATATFGTVLCGSVEMPGVGERLVARTVFGADMSACFPPVPFTIMPLPISFLPPVPFAGAPLATTWSTVTPTLIPGAFSSDHLCGVQSIAEGTGAERVSLHPVPAVDQLYLRWPSAETVTLRIRNSLGQVVGAMQVQPSDTPVQVAHLPPGSYVLHVQGRSGTTRVLPFIKE